MATLAQLESALIKADAAGNTADAKALADEIRRMRAMQAPAAAVEPVSEIPQRTLLGAIGESAGSFIPSMARQIGGLADVGGQLVSSTRTGEFPEFIMGLTDVAGGYIAKAIPERFIKDPEAAKQLIAKADAFGGAMKQRYGSYQSLLNTIATDPIS